MKRLILIVFLFALILSPSIASVNATEYTVLTPEDEVPTGTICISISQLGAYDVVDDSFGPESIVGEYVWIAPVRQ